MELSELEVAHIVEKLDIAMAELEAMLMDGLVDEFAYLGLIEVYEILGVKYGRE